MINKANAWFYEGRIFMCAFSRPNPNSKFFPSSEGEGVPLIVRICFPCFPVVIVPLIVRLASFAPLPPAFRSAPTILGTFSYFIYVICNIPELFGTVQACVSTVDWRDNFRKNSISPCHLRS